MARCVACFSTVAWETLDSESGAGVGYSMKEGKWYIGSKDL